MKTGLPPSPTPPTPTSHRWYSNYLQEQGQGWVVVVDEGEEDMLV